MKSGEAAQIWEGLVLTPHELLSQCRRETYQGSGAGGQKRNRVRSGVRLIHEKMGLRAENCEHREAGRNVESATRTLRLAMALRLGEIAAKQAENSSDNHDIKNANVGKLPRTRFRVEANPQHEDYALTAAIALSTLALNHGRLAETARDLGVTGSALTRHFKADKAIWSAVLRMREKAGLPALK